MTETQPLNKYDDSAKGGYTYEEKLAQVAMGNMDPKEIGLADAAEAQALIGKNPKPRKLGKYITFEASPVPLEIRGEWAYSELTIIPSDKVAWIEEWKEKNKDTFNIQFRLHCGNVAYQAGQSFTNEVLGFATLLEEAAIIIRKEYEREKQAEEKEANATEVVS